MVTSVRPWPVMAMAFLFGNLQSGAIEIGKPAGASYRDASRSQSFGGFIWSVTCAL